MLLSYLQDHVLIFQAIVGMLVVAAAALVLWIALRAEQDPYDAAHRSRRRAWRLRAHEPRHGERPLYTPRHESEAVVGYRFDVATDGDITVVHDAWSAIADEPTNATLEALLRREPIGAAA